MVYGLPATGRAVSAGLQVPVPPERVTVHKVVAPLLTGTLPGGCRRPER